MQKYGIPKMHHYAGFLQIGSHISLLLKFEDQMTVELWVIESFTLLCKVYSGIILSDRIILKIAVLVEYA